MTKFSMVQLALGAVHVRGIWLYQKGQRESAMRWFFLACFLHGVGIWLTAQIYHLDSRFPNGVLLWAAGILPYLIIFKLKPFVMLCSSLVCLWLSFELEFCRSGTLLLYPLFLGGFFLALRKQDFGFYSTFFPALSLFLWIENLALWKFDTGSAGRPFLLHIILFLFAAFALTEGKKAIDRTEHLRNGLLKMLLALLLLMTYEEPLRYLLNMNRYSISDFPPALVFGLLILYGVIKFSVISQLKKISLAMKTLLTIYAILIFFFLCRFLLGQDHGLTLFLTDALLLLTNITALTAAIMLIGEGIRESCSASFYTGICYIILLALCRYFDLIGGYLGGAFAFAMSGLILYASARYFARKQNRGEA
jgi:uncharacterized membrane protein